MGLRDWIDQSTPLPGAPGVAAAGCDGGYLASPARRMWRRAAGACSRLWADCAGEATVFAALIAEPVVLLLALELPAATATYPSLAEIFPAAARMQRAAADLCGVSAHETSTSAPGCGTPRGRPTIYRSPSETCRSASRRNRRSTTIRSCASRATACTRSRSDRCTLASSSPGTSAFPSSAKRCSSSKSAWATCTRASSSDSPSCSCSKAIGSRRASRAIPPSRIRGRTARRSRAMARRTVPARAAWLRRLALECERIANHLGDLGALGNDAGFAFGLAQFSRLKERWLRAIEAAFGAALPDGFRRARRRHSDPPATALAALAASAANDRRRMRP